MLETEVIVPIYTDGDEGHWYGAPICKLVRCRDCKLYGYNPEPMIPELRLLMCGRTRTFQEDPDGYCAWGERRDA